MRSYGGPIALLFVLLGLALAIVQLSSYEFGAEHLVPALLMACLPVPVYLALVLWVDRFEPEPFVVLLGAFVMGACLATFVSVNANMLAAEFLSKAIQNVGVSDGVGAVVAAPLVEEGSKALCLLILFWWRRRDFDGVMDGVIYATVLALGFAMSEDVLFYGRALKQQQASLMFLLRGVLGAFAHPLFTAMLGIGLGWFCENPGRKRRWLAPPLGLLGGILLHSLWNFSSTVHPLVWLAVYFLVMLPCGLGVGFVLLRALRREGGWLRLYLADEMSAEELAVVSSVRGRIRFSLQNLRLHGFSSWWFSEQYLQLAGQLAFLKRRLAQGQPVGKAALETLRSRMRAAQSRI